MLLSWRNIVCRGDYFRTVVYLPRMAQYKVAVANIIFHKAVVLQACSLSVFTPIFWTGSPAVTPHLSLAWS